MAKAPDKAWDILIVGAGLYGSVCAHQLKERGLRCLVLEKRPHIGGNCYTQMRDGIQLHIYGAHIFHTSSQRIWDWVRQFGEFNNYCHKVQVDYHGQRYSFPFNLKTFAELWGVNTAEQAQARLDKIRLRDAPADTLEGYALSQLGEEVYNIFIKGYTQKQWGQPPSSLPASIIKRIPIRLNNDDRYFDDSYQGIPVNGYTALIENMLAGTEVRLGVDYLQDPRSFDAMACMTLFTGPIDAFCNYRFGRLSYRSMDFHHRCLEMPDYQGLAVINYTAADIPYTRVIEHKHFAFGKQPVTWVSEEYPRAHDTGSEPMYPVRDADNLVKLRQYQEALSAPEYRNHYFGGRLTDYRYYDMHQAIGAALRQSEEIAEKLLNAA